MALLLSSTGELCVAQLPLQAPGENPRQTHAMLNQACSAQQAGYTSPPSALLPTAHTLVLCCGDDAQPPSGVWVVAGICWRRHGQHQLRILLVGVCGGGAQAA
jgi:hypothetical protein